jgi:hypothetical protein
MIEFRVERGWAFDGYQGWVIDRRANGKAYILKPIAFEFVEIEEGERLPEPSFRIDGIFAQELLPSVKNGLNSLTWLEKEDPSVNKKLEIAMQDHINSLRSVVERLMK